MIFYHVVVWLIILLLLSLVSLYYYPGVTYITYDYDGKGCSRQQEWVYLSEKIWFKKDIANTVIKIERKTGHKNVVILNWKIIHNDLW
jgi:hypothetical protein